MKTLRLFLRPDKTFPSFNRLGWEFVDVSLEDVLEKGIHPWSPQRQQHFLVREILRRLNLPEAKLPGLQEHTHDLDAPSTAYRYHNMSPFETLLDLVAHRVVFVREMSQAQLLEMAWSYLHEHWRHTVARQLLQSACPGFSRMRKFLKQKDKRLKLTGYACLDSYDLSQTLSPKDFENKERLILHEVFGVLNFRRADWLSNVTGQGGRLRLVEKIHELTISQKAPSDYGHLTWNVTRQGNVWRFRPHLENTPAKRVMARQFAKHWRLDEGELCFDTNLERLKEMAARDPELTISFPNLNYNGVSSPTRSAAHVRGPHLPAWRVGPLPSSAWTAADLKALLQEQGCTLSGNKDALITRLAEHAASLYRDYAEELDGYFSKRRFIRIASTPPKAQDFPVVENMGPDMGNLVLSMYILKHLRGNAILDPTHENDSYTLQQLAVALLNKKTALNGAFLRV